MDKVLVIPDIHGRRFWKDATEKYANEVDKIIFLGDYHDPYKAEEGIDSKPSIENFEGILTFYEANKDKTVMLIGNHDYHYIEDTATGCSRFDHANALRMKEIFSEYKDDMKLAHEEEIAGKKYLFTHAGLMHGWCETYNDIIGEPTVENINMMLGHPNGPIALWAVSRYRGGIDKSGSILWSDAREKLGNDDKLEGDWFQVFGHTQLMKPFIMETWACLDCRNAFIIDSEGFKQV